MENSNTFISFDFYVTMAGMLFIVYNATGILIYYWNFVRHLRSKKTFFTTSNGKFRWWVDVSEDSPENSTYTIIMALFVCLFWPFTLVLSFLYLIYRISNQIHKIILTQLINRNRIYVMTHPDQKIRELLQETGDKK